jgi:hypothetical protein
MRLLSIDAFIGLAKWTDSVFDVLHKPIGQSGLFLSCVFAYRTHDTNLSQLSIFSRDIHRKLLLDDTG